MNRGFTMLEVIIAITIITLAIGAVLTLTTFSISTAPLSEQKLTAAYLAQEGIEVVRNIRDSNWLKIPEQNWRTGISSGEWELEHNSTSLTYDLSVNPPRYLRLGSSGLYNYSFGPQTPFLRKIIIADNPDGDAATQDIQIRSEVSWQDRGKNYSILAEAWMYNWK